MSLSDDPIKEVKIGNEILKSLGLRNRGVKIISCPSCARQAFQVIDIVKILEEKLSHANSNSLSIIGCVVNGPGEAALTDIGITGGGKGNNMLYLSGVQSEKVLTSEIINKVVSEVEKKASELEKTKSMIPTKTIRELIEKHSSLEKELSSEIDKKSFAEKSKEYSDINEIVDIAKVYISFEDNKKDLEKILEDQNSDDELKKWLRLN